MKIGTWIECIHCKRWRYLSSVHDPSTLNVNWVCTMNTDIEYNRCSKKQQHYDEDTLIEIDYTEGSIVNAQIDGYPSLV